MPTKKTARRTSKRKPPTLTVDVLLAARAKRIKLEERVTTVLETIANTLVDCTKRKPGFQISYKVDGYLVSFVSNVFRIEVRWLSIGVTGPSRLEIDFPDRRVNDIREMALPDLQTFDSKLNKLLATICQEHPNFEKYLHARYAGFN